MARYDALAMPIVLIALAVMLILIGLVVGALVSIGVGAGLSLNRWTRWAAPLFTIIAPLAMGGAFLGAWFLPRHIEGGGMLVWCLCTALGGATGFLLGAILALPVWRRIYRETRRTSKPL